MSSVPATMPRARPMVLITPIGLLRLIKTASNVMFGASMLKYHQRKERDATRNPPMILDPIFTKTALNKTRMASISVIRGQDINRINIQLKNVRNSPAVSDR